MITRQNLLISLAALLMISLFIPYLPQDGEQWLTTLLCALLVAVFLVLIRGCRRFIMD
ncbi:hypothetical protein [Aeromonas enteropelogenes]|uniref:Uncharacterized protein n=1 Tax=Aeromonas enteropelogenes TaxID=29489 RepID=A0ABU9J785_AEREN|nr:hypothetical protein [Aeromonas enteropelogenes]